MTMPHTSDADPNSFQIESVERVKTLAYEQYAQFCNYANPGVRKQGILSPQIYQESLADESTVSIEVDGYQVPALVSLEHGIGLGYDQDRCRKLLEANGKTDGLVFTLPPHALDQDTLASLGQQLSGFEGGIFYSHNDQDQETPRLLRELLHNAGKTSAEVPLLDSTAAQGNEQASLTLYGIDVVRKDGERDVRRAGVTELFATYKNMVEGGSVTHDSENGAVLLLGSELTTDQVNDLWSLYLDRFQWLGEEHPISMEDSYEDFVSILTTDNTLCSVQFENGKPVCFGYFLDNTQPFYWLNQDYLASHIEQLPPEKVTLFFPGIVAAGRGIGYSASTIGLVAKVVGEARGEVRVLFENTNRSEAYIPGIVQKVVNRSDRLAAEQPELMDRTSYHLLSVE